MVRNIGFPVFLSFDILAMALARYGHTCLFSSIMHLALLVEYGGGRGFGGQVPSYLPTHLYIVYWLEHNITY